jgi:hypothetical protein
MTVLLAIQTHYRMLKYEEVLLRVLAENGDSQVGPLQGRPTGTPVSPAS